LHFAVLNSRGFCAHRFWWKTKFLVLKKIATALYITLVFPTVTELH